MLTENEIRPEALMKKQAELFAMDVAELMGHSASFIKVVCPACNNDDAVNTLVKTGMSFVTCTHCLTLYANPRPQPKHLDDYYSNSRNYKYWSEHIFPASEESRREKIFKPRVERILEICQKMGVNQTVVLEVGAGFGLFCEEMEKTRAFQTVVGIEPTPYLADDCRRRGVTVIEKPVEHVSPAEIAGGIPVDVIASFEVIEHLSSPEAFLKQCGQLLSPSGILIVTCPNSQGFDILTLGAESSAVDVEHINLFNPESLGLLLERCGFEVLESQTPGQLDAELVRKAFLDGRVDMVQHPFLSKLLLPGWEQYGLAFQQFLIDNKLSSNMLVVAKKAS
ncbi:MAG: class I SAM-dependent methyltransferase [Cyanobacteria bacterium P01_H01_bin.74]